MLPRSAGGCPRTSSTRPWRPTGGAATRSWSSSGCARSRRRWASRSRRPRARRSRRCSPAPSSCRREVKAAEAAQAEADEAYRDGRDDDPEPRLAARRRPAARTTTSCSSTSASRATSPPRASSRATTSSSAGCSGPSTSTAGVKVSGARFYYLTGVGADLEMALVNLAIDQARNAGFTTVIPPALVRPRAMDGTGFLGQAADDVYRIEGEDLYLVGTSEVPLAAYHSDEILDGSTVAAALRGVQPLLPQGGRLLRQGHRGHHPRALVRQGGDVQLHDRRGVVRRAPASARAGRRSSSPSWGWRSG